MTARPLTARAVFGRVIGFPRLIVEHRDLISTSVRRELRARFTGTVLGLAWPLLHPIFLFAVYYFIFTRFLGFKFGESLPVGQEAAFGVYMFVGVLVWAAFAETISRGTGVVLENGNLIKKLAFPSEVLPLNTTMVGGVTMLFGVAVFVAACLFTPVWVKPGFALLWIPLLLVLQLVFTYGLVLALSALQVFLRDTAQMVAVLLTVWMFFTPIFWAPQLIGLDKIGEFMPIIEANPMHHLIYAWRVVLMSSEPSDPIDPFPEPMGVSVAIFAVWAAASFVVGYAFFVLCQHRFADEV
ncbi:MAG: ABC transporter permease [Planctomycetota bacterium]|nr:ABC transporter permease [Planctomycetota bacterium]